MLTQAQNIVNARCIDIIEEIANARFHIATPDLVISILLQRFGVGHFDDLSIGPIGTIPALSWLQNVSSKVDALIIASAARQPILSLKDMETSAVAILRSYFLPPLCHLRPKMPKLLDPNEIILDEEIFCPQSFDDYGIGPLVCHPLLSQMFPHMYQSVNHSTIFRGMSSSDVLYHLCDVCDSSQLKSLNVPQMEKALCEALQLNRLQDVGIVLYPKIDLSLELSMLQHVLTVRLKSIAEAQRRQLDFIYSQSQIRDVTSSEAAFATEKQYAPSSTLSMTAIPKLAPPQKKNMADFVRECSQQLKLDECPYSPSFKKVQLAMLAVISRNTNSDDSNSKGNSSVASMDGNSRSHKNADSLDDDDDVGDFYAEGESDTKDRNNEGSKKQRKRKKRRSDNRNTQKQEDLLDHNNDCNISVTTTLQDQFFSAMNCGSSSSPAVADGRLGSGRLEQLLEIATDYLMLHFGGSKYRKKRWVFEEEDDQCEGDVDEDGHHKSEGDDEVGDGGNVDGPTSECDEQGIAGPESRGADREVGEQSSEEVSAKDSATCPSNMVPVVSSTPSEDSKPEDDLVGKRRITLPVNPTAAAVADGADDKPHPPVDSHTSAVNSVISSTKTPTVAATTASGTVTESMENRTLQQQQMLNNDPFNFESKIYSSFLRDPSGLTADAGVRLVENKELSRICPWVGDLDPEDLRAVGRWGEALVYHYISMSLGTKQSQSFVAPNSGASSSGSKCLGTVEWVNEKEETKAFYDIIVRCSADATGSHSNHAARYGQTRPVSPTITTYVEVKTSRFDDLNVFELSLWEWQFATGNPRVRYHIYRVFNAGDPNKVRIVVIEDVLQMIQERKVKLCLAV